MRSVVEFGDVAVGEAKHGAGGVCGKLADKEGEEKAMGVVYRGERLNFNCFVCANAGLTHILSCVKLGTVTKKEGRGGRRRGGRVRQKSPLAPQQHRRIESFSFSFSVQKTK